MSSPRGGRPRKPDALKKLQGTARADRKRSSTAHVKGMPKRPTGLSEQAVRIWKSLGPKLHELGLLAEMQTRTYHESQGKPTYYIRKLLDTPIDEAIAVPLTDRTLDISSR